MDVLLPLLCSCAKFYSIVHEPCWLAWSTSANTVVDVVVFAAAPAGASAAAAVVQPLPVAVAILVIVVVVRVGVTGAVAGAAGAAALIEAVSPGGVVVVLSSASVFPCFSLCKLLSIALKALLADFRSDVIAFEAIKRKMST